LPNKQRLFDSKFTRQQYTVYGSDLENFRQNIDELQILIIVLHF